MFRNLKSALNLSTLIPPMGAFLVGIFGQIQLVRAEVSEVLLVCPQLPAQVFKEIVIGRDFQGLKSQIFTKDGDVLEEYLSEIEWTRLDLTIPNYENHAYRLIFESLPNQWRLIQYSPEGNHNVWTVTCKPDLEAGL